MAERGYRNLNASVLRQISKTLERDSAADLESILQRLHVSYAELRKAISQRQEKRRGDDGLGEQNPPLKKHKHQPSLPDTLLTLVSPIQPQLPQNHPRLLGSPLTKSVSCTLPHTMIFPLSPTIRDLLKISDVDTSDVSSTVVGLVHSGVPIWNGRSRAVVQVGENVVVKVAQHLDHDEPGVLQFLEEHFPSIPVPRALGLITIGSTSFMFMTMISGTTLETRWPSLSMEAKKHVQGTLDRHLTALRRFELPQGAPLGSPIGRRVCKDVRRDERISTSPIYSEAQFNDFLLNSPACRSSPSYKKWLDSMLHTNHRMVFSHADLHPRNVMVVDGPDEIIEVAGILDWESSGFYPEYWEQLKAMNTRSIRDTSDWWDYLPPSILGYDHEVVVDRVIESTMM